MRFSRTLVPILFLGCTVSATDIAADPASESTAPEVIASAAANPLNSFKSWLNSAQVVLVDRVNSVSTAVRNSLAASELLSNSVGTVERSKAAKIMKNIEVKNLTMTGWKDTLLAPAIGRPGQTAEWMVLMTGGKKMCQGECGNLTKAWEDSIPLFSALPQPPHLGLLDCETEVDLCHSWFTGPAGMWHFLITLDPTQTQEEGRKSDEQAGSEPVITPSSPPFHSSVRLINLSRTNTTKTDIVEIFTEETWKNTPLLKSTLFHPFDGLVAQYDLGPYVAKLLTWFGGSTAWISVLVLTRAISWFRAKPKKTAREVLAERQEKGQQKKQ